jgi:Skp family chaperone for outer membrane proteins
MKSNKNARVMVRATVGFAAVFGPLVASLVVPVGAYAQQAPDWFVPGQAPRSAAPGPARPAARPSAPPRAPVQSAPIPAPEPQAQVDNQPPPNLPTPPVPELPPLPKGAAPPTAVIGVLGVPEVMRASTAAQTVEKVIGERREKLNQDAQKEQAAWRDMQQALTTQRTTLSADQQHNRERELQERITNAQRSFRDRNRIIQEAAQVALGQIERELIAVIRQVAESRGMNLVLHRAQVALNINEFDITEAVTTQLNQVLPSVVIPPDGQVPTAANTQIPAAPVTAAATPAAAPATPAPAAPGSAATATTASAPKKK